MYRKIKKILSIGLVILLIISTINFNEFKRFITSFSNEKSDVNNFAENILTPELDLDIVVGQLEEVVIERVVDGDTVIVIDDNGNSFKVRLIGIDTPESVHPDKSKNNEAGILASEYTKSRLIPGDTVYLEYGQQKTDKYNRTLAYLWLTDDVVDAKIQDIISKLYNAELIIQGYAIPKVYEPNTKYHDCFQRLYDNKLDTEKLVR